MADRIIRSDILTSDSVNLLSWPAEVFYRRLMSIADDFGRYDGRASLLRGSLYSLKLDKVSEADIAKWLDECQKAGLVSFYHVDGKPYLEILKFGQRLRIMKSKYPEPDSNPPQSAAIRRNPPPETKRSRNDIEVETEVEGEPAPSFFLIPEMEKVWLSLNPGYPKDKQKDFAALGDLSRYLSELGQSPYQPGDSEFLAAICNEWKVLAEFVVKDNFYKSYSLAQISKHFQNIYQSKKNGTAVKRTDTAKPGSILAPL